MMYSIPKSNRTEPAKALIEIALLELLLRGLDLILPYLALTPSTKVFRMTQSVASLSLSCLQTRQITRMHESLSFDSSFHVGVQF